MTPRKILAIKLRSLGDTVLMTAPLLELRRAYPQAEIHVAAPQSYREILVNHPAVDRLVPIDLPSSKLKRALFLPVLMRKLRRENYDCVVCFHASPSTALIALGTGAKTRAIHFHGHQDTNRFSTVVIPDKGKIKPIIERDLDTVRALGISTKSLAMPKVFITADERKAVQARLNNWGLKNPILGLGLGAGRPSKTWPMAKFAEVARAWQARGGSVVLFSTPPEAEKVTEFWREIERRNISKSQIVSEAKLSLRELAAWMEVLSVFLGNDSGPKHLAVAVGTPTVTLFGPEHPFEWHPYPTDLHPYFFIENLACRKDAAPGMPAWCGIYTCLTEKNRCLTEIAAEPVLQKCFELCDHGNKEAKL